MYDTTSDHHAGAPSRYRDPELLLWDEYSNIACDDTGAMLSRLTRWWTLTRHFFLSCTHAFNLFHAMSQSLGYPPECPPHWVLVPYMCRFCEEPVAIHAQNVYAYDALTNFGRFGTLTACMSEPSTAPGVLIV